MSVQDTVDTVPLRGALSLLRRRWRILAASIVLLAVAAAAISATQQKKYTATASLLFRDPRLAESLAGAAATRPSQDATRAAATNLRLISLPRVAVKTSAALAHRLTPGQVRNKVAVSSEGASDIVTIRATDTSAFFAARLANAFAQQFIAFRRAADLKSVKAAQDLVDLQLSQLSAAQRQTPEGIAMRDRAEQLKILGSLQTGGAELVQPAGPPSSPSSPKPRRDGMIGGLVGLILGFGLAFVRERLDRRLTEPAELQQAYGVPVLGMIPESKALVAEGAGSKLPVAETEAFRALHTRLRYYHLDQNVRSVLVTSAAPGDGKTTVAWNLAAAAAASGLRVLLLEADLRRPALARLLRLQRVPGLSEALRGQAKGYEVVQQVGVPGHTNGHGSTSILDVIVAGEHPANPVALMESSNMVTAIRAFSLNYDLTVIDTPPGAVVSDAMPLMSQVDGVVIVSRLGKNTYDMAAGLHDQLRNLGAPILGVIANRVTKRTDAYYGYGYGYGYGELPPTGEIPGEPAAAKLRADA